MKNTEKDRVSESSDDDEIPATQIADNQVNNSKNNVGDKSQRTIVNESDSDSEDILSPEHERLISGKSNRKTPTKTVKQGSSPEKVTKKKSESAKSTFYFEDLTSDDEVYMFQCPSKLKKEELCDKSIGSVNSNRNEQYQFEILKSEKKFITLAVPGKTKSGGILKLPLKGHIVIHKVLNTPPSDQACENYSKKKSIVFPQDIKLRHPLLGVDWEAHIKAANAALKKRKHKKHKSSKNYSQEIEVSKSCKRESNEVESPSKKRKKIKNE